MEPLRIGKTVYKVSDFLSWQKLGSLELSPSFQRRPVWPETAKSYLMDTIVRGLPMPIVFVRERTNLDTLEPRREVVDGQQRLRTLIGFVEPAALPDYDLGRDSFVVKRGHNADIAGKSYRQLPKDVQARILNYEFSVHILPSDTDDREVLEIFARLNSTGVRVNGQEIRNALFSGLFKSTMYELAYEQLSRWRTWGIFDETQIARMEEVEATSEFALLMLQGIQGKRQKALDTLYETKDDEFKEEDEIRHRFKLVMDEIDSRIGLSLRTLVWSRQALFYTIFSFLYDLMFGLESGLAKATPKRLPSHLSQCIESASETIRHGDLPEDLAKALRGATSHKGTRQTRLDFLRQVCRASAT